MHLLYFSFHFILFREMLWKVKEKSLRSWAASLKGHHNLSWTGDAARRKVSISNLELKLFSKKFQLFQLKPQKILTPPLHTGSQLAFPAHLIDIFNNLLEGGGTKGCWRKICMYKNHTSIHYHYFPNSQKNAGNNFYQYYYFPDNLERILWSRGHGMLQPFL